ncbi:DUF3173 family protein [Aerococcaceae bacterium WGS1372]
MVDYKKIMEFGLKKHTAQSVIREAKEQLVQEGYEFYENQRCGVVPVEKVESILGIKLIE